MPIFTLLNILTALVLGGISVWATIRAVRTCSRPNWAAPVVFVLLIIFAIPVGLDFIFGVPAYENSFFETLLEGRRDDLTSCLYNLYISGLIFLFARCTEHSKLMIEREEVEHAFGVLNRFSPLLYFFVLLPLLVFPFTSDPLFFVSFGVERLGFERVNLADLHLSKFCFLSVICASLLWALNRRLGLTGRNIFLALLILLACLFQGKRSLFFLAGVFYFGGAYFSGKNFGWMLKRAVVFLCLLILFFASYGKNIGTVSQTYSALRIDFGRDTVCKHTMKKVLLDGENIVNFPGQSFIFTSTLWIPRAYWPGKPYPYAVYLTNSVLPEHVRLRRIYSGDWHLGWGLTTSIVEEVIANFKWFGFLFPLGALAGLFFIQRLSFIPRCIAYGVFILLLGIEAVAILPLFLIFGVGLLVWRTRKLPKYLLHKGEAIGR